MRHLTCHLEGVPREILSLSDKPPSSERPRWNHTMKRTTFNLKPPATSAHPQRQLCIPAHVKPGPANTNYLPTIWISTVAFGRCLSHPVAVWRKSWVPGDWEWGVWCFWKNVDRIWYQIKALSVPLLFHLNSVFKCGDLQFIKMSSRRDEPFATVQHKHHM